MKWSLIQGSFCVCTQPMRDGDVTLSLIGWVFCTVWSLVPLIMRYREYTVQRLTWAWRASLVSRSLDKPFVRPLTMLRQRSNRCNRRKKMFTHLQWPLEKKTFDFKNAIFFSVIICKTIFIWNCLYQWSSRYVHEKWYLYDKTREVLIKTLIFLFILHSL